MEYLNDIGSLLDSPNVCEKMPLGIHAEQIPPSLRSQHGSRRSKAAKAQNHLCARCMLTFMMSTPSPGRWNLIVLTCDTSVFARIGIPETPGWFSLSSCPYSGEASLLVPELRHGHMSVSSRAGGMYLVYNASDQSTYLDLGLKNKIKNIRCTRQGKSPEVGLAPFREYLRTSTDHMLRETVSFAYLPSQMPSDPALLEATGFLSATAQYEAWITNRDMYIQQKIGPGEIIRVPPSDHHHLYQTSRTGGLAPCSCTCISSRRRRTIAYPEPAQMHAVDRLLGMMN